MDCPHNSVTQLLDDVSHFLDKVLSSETLSEHAETQRGVLLQRLSLHLPTVSSPTTPPPYLDMNGTLKGIDQLEEYVDVGPPSQCGEQNQDFYEESPEFNVNGAAQDESNQVVSYENIQIPISKLREEAKKFGPLCRKEKFLFMEHLIRIWAGLKHELLFLYNSERDTKPSSVLYLWGYEARPAPLYYSKDSKKRACCFELVCPGKKTHQFIARTPKDMEQWVTSINDACRRNADAHNKVKVSSKRRLPSLPGNSNMTDIDEYDDIEARNTTYDDDEIYHVIPDSVDIGDDKEEAPVLPKRLPKNDSFDSNSVYDDVGVNNANNVYYNVRTETTVTTNSEEIVPETTPKAEEEEEDIYDDIGILERDSEPPKPLFQDGTNSPGRIHHIIQKMEANIVSGKMCINSYVKPEPPQSPSNANIPSEELYEPIDIQDENTCLELQPKLPPRTNLRF